MKPTLKQISTPVLLSLALIFAGCSSSSSDSTAGTDAGTDAGTAQVNSVVNGFVVIGSEVLDDQGMLAVTTVYTLDESTNTISGVQSSVVSGVATATRNTTDTYDSFGNKVTELVAPIGSTDTGTYTYTYDNQGLLIERLAVFSDGGDTKATFEYNENNALIRRTTVVVATGEEQIKYDYTVNEDGKPVTSTSSFGSTATYEYNIAGQLISVTRDTGSRREYAYDDDGNVTSQTDYLRDGALDKVTNYTYQATTEDVYNDRLRMQRDFP